MRAKQNILALSDEDLVAQAQEKRPLPSEDHTYADNVCILTEDLLVKRLPRFANADCSEALAMELVAKHTTIPVPRVRRVVTTSGSFFIIMDRIPGRQLATVWSSMTDAQKDQVAATLQGYVQQLRDIDIPRRSIPGPLASGDKARKVPHSPVFEAIITQRGPFQSYDKLEQFFNSRREIMHRVSGGNFPEDIPLFDASYPLVMTHSDLNPRNVLVGEDGQLWLLDWAYAGFFPEWWESVCMERRAVNEEQVSGVKDPKWRAIVPTVCGSYPEMHDYIRLIEPAYYWV